MRKLAIGILIGFCLSFAIGAHAEVVNMVGKVVDGIFKVTVDGRQLEQDGIVIEGITYLPVRLLGETVGYNVYFDPGLGVSLTKKTVGDVVYQPDPTPTPTQPTPAPSTLPTKNNLNRVNELIEIRRIDIQALKMGMESGGPNDPHYAEYQARLKTYEYDLIDLQNQKAALTP